MENPAEIALVEGEVRQDIESLELEFASYMEEIFQEPVDFIWHSGSSVSAPLITLDAAVHGLGFPERMLFVSLWRNQSFALIGFFESDIYWLYP